VTSPATHPFLRELAQYEWLEADVLFDPRELADVTVDDELDLLDACAVPNPVLRPATYHYPVQHIGPTQQPRAPAPAPIYLVVYRRRDDTAGFMELNAVAARLLELILSQPTTSSRALLHVIARELAHPDPQTVVSWRVHRIGDLFPPRTSSWVRAGAEAQARASAQLAAAAAAISCRAGSIGLRVRRIARTNGPESVMTTRCRPRYRPAAAAARSRP
jgi:hypothetical protein